MGLRLGTKIYWFVQNPKNSSYVPSTVTVMYGTFLKRIQNFRNMPFSKNIELCVTVSVLEAVDVHLSDKKGLMVIGKYFFQILFHFTGQLLRKSPKYSRVPYKYPFLSCLVLFKANGVKSLFGLSLWVDCLGFSFASWRQIGGSQFACIISGNTNSKLRF